MLSRGITVNNRIFLISIVTFHYLVFVAFLLTSIMSFFQLPWYIALTINALIFRVIFSRAECPLTTLENNIRKKLNMPVSKGFLTDYIIFPLRTLKSFIKHK